MQEMTNMKTDARNDKYEDARNERITGIPKNRGMRSRCWEFQYTVKRLILLSNFYGVRVCAK